jgi:hypothetical protein
VVITRLRRKTAVFILRKYIVGFFLFSLLVLDNSLVRFNNSLLIILRVLKCYIRE